MTLTMPDIDVDRIMNFAHSAAFAVITVLCFIITFEALVMKSLNLAMLEGLLALMRLF